MVVGLHVIVKGRVQGVGFRYFVAETAAAHDIHGYTRNLFNGDVEIEAQGERPALEQFLMSVQKGPRLARVVDVLVEWKQAEVNFSDFQVR